jgi:hypothetical protein
MFSPTRSVTRVRRVFIQRPLSSGVYIPPPLLRFELHPQPPTGISPPFLSSSSLRNRLSNAVSPSLVSPGRSCLLIIVLAVPLSTVCMTEEDSSVVPPLVISSLITWFIVPLQTRSAVIFRCSVSSLLCRWRSLTDAESDSRRGQHLGEVQSGGYPLLMRPDTQELTVVAAGPLSFTLSVPVQSLSNPPRSRLLSSPLISLVVVHRFNITLAI